MALIAAGALLALGVVFWGWRHLPLVASLTLLAACGAMVGSGALLVQDVASSADWAITLVVLGALTPLHGWLLVGRPREP